MYHDSLKAVIIFNRFGALTSTNVVEDSEEVDEDTNSVLPAFNSVSKSIEPPRDPWIPVIFSYLSVEKHSA